MGDPQGCRPLAPPASPALSLPSRFRGNPLLRSALVLPSPLPFLFHPQLRSSPPSCASGPSLSLFHLLQCSLVISGDIYLSLKKKKEEQEKSPFHHPSSASTDPGLRATSQVNSQSPEGRPGPPPARLSPNLTCGREGGNAAGGCPGAEGSRGAPQDEARAGPGPWGEADPESLVTGLQQERTAVRGSPTAPPGTPSPCEEETRPGPRPWHPVGAQCPLSPNGMLRLAHSSKHTPPGSNRPQRTARTRSLLRTSGSPPCQAEVSAGSSFQFPFHYCLLSFYYGPDT